MFCSRSQKGLSNGIDERALRLIYNNHTSSFEVILEIFNEKTMHQKILEFLLRKSVSLKQARSREFLRAGEVSGN